MAKFTFGTDPEFMLMDKYGNYKSAIEIVPGDKHNRHKIGENYFYYDNIMAEMAIPPARNKSEAINYLKRAIADYAQLVAKQQCVLLCRASANYPAAELQHPKALEIGCDPEFCCYGMKKIDPPTDNFKNGTLRSAGGHIHLGFSFIRPNDFLGCCRATRICDLFLGVFSIFLDKDPTTVARKALYGKAGRFRNPPHGVEYRSLGNFWLASPKLTGFIYDTCAFLYDFLSGSEYENLWYIDEESLNDDDIINADDFDISHYHICQGYQSDTLQKAIDTMDKQTGEKFLSLIEKYLPSNILRDFNQLKDYQPKSLYEEWGI